MFQIIAGAVFKNGRDQPGGNADDGQIGYFRKGSQVRICLEITDLFGLGIDWIKPSSKAAFLKFG